MSSMMTDEEEEAWLQHMEDEDDDEARGHLETWILPQSAGFFDAPSGHRLHVRAVLPPDDPSGHNLKAVVLYCHGLNSHVNSRAWADGVYPRIASEGFAVYALDIMGHGYSDGARSLVVNWEDVFEDLHAFLEALMDITETTAEDFNAGIPDEVLSRVRRLPVFVHGVSMGGMIGMYVGLRLQGDERLKDKFKGCILGCPSLAVDLPSPFVQSLLRNFVVPLFKQYEMPPAVSSSSKPHPSWSYDLHDPRQEEIAAMEVRDCAARFPEKGLGWHKKMLWGTAGAFSSVYSGIDEAMGQVEYPFLIMHDPGDKVCFIAGSQRLMELSRSDDKTLLEVDANGRHSLPVVIQEKYVATLGSWIKQRLL